MNVEKLGKEILEAVGGSKNVDRLTHCITRLRFNLKDESLADDKKVKSISGVMGVMNQSGQYQVIVGNNVDKVYDSILPSINQNDKSVKQGKKVGFFSKVIDAVSSILSPLIPPLAAAGMIKVILLILTQVNLLSKKSDTYIVLNMIAGAAFVFMPIAVAYCSSVKFKTNPVMSIVLAGVLLHPKFTGLLGKPDAALTVFGAPIMIVKYSATVLPAMMMVWFMSYVEKFAEKVSPQVIKVFFKPLLIMLIVAPVTLVAIGPIGSIAGNGLASVFAVLQLKANWAAVALLSSVYSLLVMIGMHRALTPIGLSLFGSLGYEPLMKAASLCSNFSQASACLAVSLKTKNSNLKQVASSASATAFISGITEPAMYGVTLKLKRPLIACIMSSGLAGLYAGFTMVKAYAYATPGLFSFAMFMGPDTNNIIHAIISALIAIVGAFVFTWILGFEDPIEEEEVVLEKNIVENEEKQNVEIKKDLEIGTVVKGKVVPLNEVKDDTFASGICGMGIAVFPEDDILVSPVDAKLSMVFKTKHAFVFTTKEGLELLIHIGIDTVNLEGKYFELLKSEGETVKKGEAFVKINREAMEAEGYDITTCIVVTNLSENANVSGTKKTEVNLNDTIFTVEGND